MTLENGQQHEGDLLVGADGIWSKVQFFAPHVQSYVRGSYIYKQNITFKCNIDLEVVIHDKDFGKKMLYTK